MKGIIGLLLLPTFAIGVVAKVMIEGFNAGMEIGDRFIDWLGSDD